MCLQMNGLSLGEKTNKWKQVFFQRGKEQCSWGTGTGELIFTAEFAPSAYTACS